MVLQYIFITIMTLLASIIGTLSGFGISSILIPVMSLFYPLPFTLLFVGIIHLFGNIWKIMFFKSGFDWKLILWFGIPGILASYIGASIILNLEETFLKRSLGAFLLLYIVFVFIQKNWKIPSNTKTSFMGGSLSGFFAGLFGVGGTIRSAFLTAFDLPKATFIATSGMIALFIDVTRIYRYFSGGVSLPTQLLIFLGFLVPVTLLGAWFAKNIVNKVPQKLFRSLILVFIGLIALKFLIIS